MKARIERRLVPLEGFEFRAAEGDRPAELIGYASVFNTETVIGDWFGEWREEVSPGAFKKTIREADIRALWNHDPNVVLGRNKAGTLELEEDDHGLRTVIKPPDNEWGRPVLDAVRRGDVTGMSITFSVIKEALDKSGVKDGELPKRTIKEARLYDVSPVTFPAFEQTEINARAVPEAVIAEDVLLRAGALARRAQMGQVLAAEDRGAIAEAVSILSSELEKPTGIAETASHFSTATEAEPDASIDADHSSEARARRLRLIRMITETTGETR